MVGLRFSQLQVAAAAFGTQAEESFAAFTAVGCTSVLDGNLEVLKSPIGDAEFLWAFCLKVAAKQRDTWTFLAELGDPHSVFAASCNLALSDKQRARVNFSGENGGIGLRSIAERIDGAYVASRAATHELCRRIRPQHHGDHANRGSHL